MILVWEFAKWREFFSPTALEDYNVKSDYLFIVKFINSKFINSIMTHLMAPVLINN